MEITKEEIEKAAKNQGLGKPKEICIKIPVYCPEELFESAEGLIKTFAHAGFLAFCYVSLPEKTELGKEMCKQIDAFNQTGKEDEHKISTYLLNKAYEKED